MSAWLLLALLWGCSPTDPELQSQRAALEQWRAGVQALEEGDPVEAERHFEEALTHRPEDPVLRAWQATAVARQGETERAVAQLDVLLASYPNFAEARYNRAAYLARLEEPEAAAADLKRALDDGAAKPRDVLKDPDFQPWLDHEAFAFLPKDGLTVAVEPPEGVIFLGSRATLRFRIFGSEGEPVSLQAVEAGGPVRLISVVEDHVLTSEGEGHDLTFTFEVMGEGEVAIGPLEIRANDHRAEVRAITFQTAAPEGHTPGAVPPLSLITPTERGASVALGAAVWSEPILRIKTEPGDRVHLEPDPGPPSVRMELREQGRTIWVLHEWVLPEAPSRIRILRGDEVLLDGPPEVR